jgi:hypothetical protein
MSSPAKREKKGARPAKQDGIDEGTFTSFPSPPHRCAVDPFLSRFAGEETDISIFPEIWIDRWIPIL